MSGHEGTPPAPGDLIVAHLVLALGRHRRWCRMNGTPWPVALDALFAALSAATSGPQRPEVAESNDPGEPLLVDEFEAARRLAVSERTVRRLVASGELPSVVVGRCRRFRPSELEDFVNGLETSRGA